MEMQQLRYVVAVAREGTFSRAAAKCHVAQPSLSQQIQKLEDELGERLFDRLKRQARLTPQGELFLRRAVRILDEAEAARREASEGRELLRGSVSIGALPTIAPYVLPGLMASFAKNFPGVEMVVHEDTTARLREMLLAYEIDFALMSNPMEDERLETKLLFAEELLLALPPGHPLARKRALRVADLEGERLIVMKPGHCLGDQTLGFCDRRGVKSTISFRSAQLETIQALVASGLGLSLIPKMAVRAEKSPAPVYRSFPAPRPQRQILAVWPRQRPPGRAASELLKIASASARNKSISFP